MASTGALIPMPMPVATSGTLEPTWQGYIGNTTDAMMLLEACFSGSLNHLARRPHDKERPELIKSGNIFIHEANSSGVKRWTDGITWSPSRMVGNFLVYRELNKPFAPGEKKRATAKDKRQGIQKKRGGGANQSRVYSSVHGALSKDLERSLVGSLVDSYDFKEDDICLIKKTITIKVRDLTHHIVSYYTIDDVVSGRLQTPRSEPRFQHLKPRRDIIQSKSYKHPPDDPNVLNEDDDVRENHSSFQNHSGRGDYNFANRNAPRLPAPSMNNMPYQSNNFFANNHYAMGVGPTSYNLSSYNGSLPAVTSGASSYNGNLSGAIPNTVSPYNGAIPATSSNGGSYAQYAQVPGMYDQKPETYGNVYRQRHNSNPSMNTTPLGHRPSGYGQQSLGSGVPEVVSGMSGMLQGQMGSRNPHETGIPGMFQGQMGSRNINETGYTSGSIYQSRDSPNTPHGYSQAQRALPGSNQPYNPQAANQYNQHMEASPGNASAGHAHYMMNTQANWPSPNGV
ncbi:hypothetical protein EYC80_000024 [Monilinia laxa]|uniref:Gti1/Pac2 family protein n=1 Tax=Monilinia laxa TaxID=61186 RepID=A0A5N6K9H5_MONLA|nr:hypothetical protein EYC80_000024 [Monilinia laxa]